MVWIQGEVFRCSDPDCGCEMTLTQIPRAGRGDLVPTCCGCGKPMKVS